MADERIITELIVQGAEQSVRQIESVATASTQLVSVQETAGVRQRQVYDSVATAALASAQAQEKAARQAQEAIQRIEEQTTKSIVDNAARQREARRTAAAQTNDRVAQSRTAIFSAPVSSLGGLQERISSSNASTLRQITTATDEVTQASVKKNRALQEQSGQHGKNTSTGITYLSVLSAIHAASFLATNQTFSMVGSFTTLGLAFSKLGPGAAAVGLAFGGFLAIFGQVSNAMQQIQQAAENTVTSLVKVAAAVTGVAVGAGATGVKLAADVETQLAAVRAFGGATNAQLQQVEEQAGTLARTFGISAASVVEATSLFARAGGTVADALAGATEAIVKLQTASAGELSAAQSAIIVSAALKQFNLTGDQAGRVADNLTAAFQGSALSAAGVQQAFIQAAPGAAALNISIEDLSASIALIGDQLIKGTTTGTAFKQFILDIIHPTKQAQEIFNKYGITVQDAAGNLRPFIDIVNDLNKALGDEAVQAGTVGTAERERAIATIFGSRAFLAANILTREGAAGLQRYREELAKTTTTNIVDILLLPLNKQLERLRVNAEEVARAFGGPLLEPIRNTVTSAIALLDNMRKPAELLGQTISVLATGEGFGQLQQNIQALAGDNQLSAFLIQVVNSFRNVRDVIISEIIPAIRFFITSIGNVADSATSGDKLETTFNNINNAIQRVGTIVGIAIRQLALLATEFVNNEGRGGELRQQILDIATSIATNLILSLATSVIFLTLAAKAMTTFGQISLAVASKLGPIFRGLAEGTKAVSDEMVTLELTTRKALLGAQLGQAIANNDIPEVQRLSNELETVNKLINAPRVIHSPFQDMFNDLANATSGAQQFSEELQGLLNVDKLRTQASATLSVFTDLGGEITNALSNITEQVNQVQRGVASGAPGGPGVQLINPAALKAAENKVDEAARDLNRRLANISEDAATKVGDSLAAVTLRLTEIFTRAKERLSDLQQQTDERVQEIFSNIAERRADRAILDPFKKAQEDRFTIFQRELDKEENAEQRRLDHSRTDRTHDNEDAARVVERGAQDVETAEQRKQSAAQRTFDIIQHARETAFDRAQGLEATAFQRSQQAQADARQFTQQLAAAKTPEDVANVTRQHQQAIDDNKFQQKQEDELTRFRQTQEDKKTKFSQDAEVQAIVFRQGQEDKFTEFRRQQELILIDFRRNAEAAERTVRESEEDTALQRRLRREDIITARRRQDELDLQDFTDQIENKNAERQANKIIAKANEEHNKIIRTAQDEAGNAIESFMLQIDKQSEELDKQLRGVLDTLKDLADGGAIPADVLAAVQGKILGLQQDILTKSGQIRGNLGDLRDQAKLQASQQAAVGNAGLETQIVQPATTQQVTPLAVISAATMQVSNLFLPTGFNVAVANAVLFGIQQAADQGIIPNIGPVDLNPLEQGVESIRKFFRA